MGLIVGLGNPGQSYNKTRHNIGFMVIDEISKLHGCSQTQKKFDAEIEKGVISNQKLLLIKPMSYMNLSGLPLKRIIDYFRISIENMVIIHDDLDLNYGIIKIKEKGGHGGHKGLKSIIDTIGHNNFYRVRMGIGRPNNKMDVSDFVLNPFSTDEKEYLTQFIKTAKDAVSSIISDGIKEAMNRFNQKNIKI